VLAVYEQEVRSLVRSADPLLKRHPPIDALESWLERLARYAVTKHGLADALRKATTPGSDLSSTDTYPSAAHLRDRRPRATPIHLTAAGIPLVGRARELLELRQIPTGMNRRDAVMPSHPSLQECSSGDWICCLAHGWQAATETSYRNRNRSAPANCACCDICPQT
jgi:hypothetical protein